MPGLHASRKLIQPIFSFWLDVGTGRQGAPAPLPPPFPGEKKPFYVSKREGVDKKGKKNKKKHDIRRRVCSQKSDCQYGLFIHTCASKNAIVSKDTIFYLL